MVTKAEAKDKQQILSLWKEAFSFDDGGYTKFFFDRYYRNDQTFVLKEEDEVISSAIKTPHCLMLHGKMIQASMSVGVVTHPEHRHKGHFHHLMDVVLDECSHQELVTVIQAYDPELYKEFGFDVVYRRKQMLIKRADVPQMADHGITYRLDYKHLVKVYSQFTAKFDGMMVRDEAYFRDLSYEVEAQGGKILACYDSQGEITGYAVLYLVDGVLTLQEIVYLDSRSLMKILNHCLQLRFEVVVEVSEAEQLEKLFSKAEVKHKGNLMVRVNQKDLFQRLYGFKHQSVQQAMETDKPLWYNETH